MSRGRAEAARRAQSAGLTNEYKADGNLIFPADVFIGYGSEIHLVEADKRQRKPKSVIFRDAWELILQRAVQKETFVRTPVKFGEAVHGVIPSQALITDEVVREGVET